VYLCVFIHLWIDLQMQMEALLTGVVERQQQLADSIAVLQQQLERGVHRQDAMAWL
jgi:hypothetical protein